MRSTSRLMTAALLLAFSTLVSGCAGGGFDPSDLMDWLDTKKKLPGDRRAVFPEGVPGIEPGVPADMMKGAQAEKQRQEEQAAAEAASKAEEEKRKAEAKAAARKAKPKVARKPVPPPPAVDDSSEPAQVTVQRPPAQRQPQQPAESSPFPAPLPSGSFSR